ncbi:hypothetical protein TNIN_73991 [Trichonephila inaurata madagascariensis]|uniref:Uncharacterized protein n=1 Tax=Trichonephila inaurata madagascariensis TaxID=2747483 RepID=A0A8X6YTD5_9ARAC|nr:hypothetical protein TNIN_103961 [Trichonephila inaurata madagascariensis]GFY75374.1 hypothetical protein TNIN_73991 [Trichonephila inaurata madagascariensis]
MKNDLPSLLEILIVELVLELIEHCYPIQSFDGAVLDTHLVVQSVTIVNEFIPIVHCFTVGKICEAFDLKVKFVLLLGTTVFSGTPHRGVDQTTAVPVLGSFSVWKICHTGVGSSRHLRLTVHQNHCFSEAAQTDTSGTVNCCF